MSFIFEVGYPMAKPHTRNVRFGALDYETIRTLSPELTEREAASPFARYFYEPMGKLESEHIAALAAAPIASGDCYMPSEAAAHLNNPYDDIVENAYGVMDNGVGFAAIRIHQDGINDDMIRYFNDHFARFDNIYYKIWFPHAHLLHYEDGAVENFGWDMLNMHMTFTADLSSLGFDESRIRENDPNCIRVQVFGGTFISTTNPMKGEEVSSMVQYHRKTPTGREIRVRYWIGLNFDDRGQPYVKLMHDDTSTLQRAKLMMEHCMREYRNQARLVRAFWEDTH